MAHTWRVTCMSSLTSRQQEKGWPALVRGGHVYKPWASLSRALSRSMRFFLATRQPDACKYSFPPLQIAATLTSRHFLTCLYRHA